jgi:oligopeptide transport system substrate-binding protein
MDEMGVDDPVDVSVNVWFNRDEVDEDILEAVAEQWETNLGIKVNMVSSDWAAYVETLDECSR